MATKDNSPVLFKDNQNNVTENDQYKNLTLNKNHQISSDAFSGRSQSERSKVTKRMKRTAAPTKLSDFANDDDSQAKKESHSWNKSPKDLSPCFANKGVGKENLKKGKSLNSSTLSLYIEAYENSNEDYLCDVTQEGLKKIEKGFNVKQIDFDPTAVIQNAFEFSRQQENGEAVNPEIAQYSASQHLLDPNVQAHQAQQPLPRHPTEPSQTNNLKMANIYDELSNEELREELIQRGFTVGPINAATRKVYVRKLMNHSTSGKADLNTSRNHGALVDLTDEAELINGGDDMYEDVGSHEATPDSEFVETDTNGHATEYGHESDQSDYMESSRILTPEEARQRFISPMAHRRKMVKKSQSRMQMVVMFCLGLLIVYALFYFISQNMYMDNKNMAVKTADTEL